MTSNNKFSVVAIPMKEEEDNQDQPTATVIVNEYREGKDEMNLVELPSSLISNRNTKKIGTIKRQWLGRDRHGNAKDCWQTITGSSKRGLPTFQAEEITIAALELTFKKSPLAQKVPTTQYEMCGLLGWPYTIRYRKLLRDMFALLKGVTIETNHFYNAEIKDHEWATYGIISNAHFSDGAGYFIWDNDFWSYLQRGNIKPLDTGIYFSLNFNTSKRLFRYADRHVYNGQKHEIDLERLCLDKLLMLGNYQGSKQLIRKIEPAIDEINDIERDGYKLFRIRVAKSKTTPSGYKIVFEKHTKSRQSHRDQEKGVEGQGSAETSSERENEALESMSEADQSTLILANLLIERGIRPRAAAQLVTKYAPRIPRQIEVFDFLLQQPDHKIKNPAAYLRKSIEEHWWLAKTPDGFKSRVDQEAELQDQQEAGEELAREYLEQRDETIQDVAATMKLSDEQRVAPLLYAWEQMTRKVSHRAPAPEELAQRQSRYIKNLPSRDQLLDQRLKELARQFEDKAREQGITAPDFS